MSLAYNTGKYVYLYFYIYIKYIILYISVFVCVCMHMYIRTKILVWEEGRVLEQTLWKFTEATIMCKNYWENCEKRPSVASHKQFKTLLRANMVKLKIISLYIFKDLRLRSSESRDHYHGDGNLVPSPRCGFSFEASFQLWGLKLTLSEYIRNATFR